MEQPDLGGTHQDYWVKSWLRMGQPQESHHVRENIVQILELWKIVVSWPESFLTRTRTIV